MKIEVRKQLEKYIKIKDEKSMNKIIWTIKARFDKYGHIGLSRLENKNFNISERQLSYIIKQMIDNKLLIFIGKVKSKYNFLCNVYELSEEFKKILSLFKSTIEFLNEKIIKFNKEANIVKILNKFGIQTKGNKLKNNKKITFNKRKNVISNWETNIHYNLFNFLKLNIGNYVYKLIK